MRRLVFSLGLLFLLMLSLASAFDPQRLVGEWEGQWKTPRVGDAIHMTIKKVEGTRVEGSMYIRGRLKYHNRDISFVGAIDGMVFTANTPTLPGEPPIRWTLQVNDEATEMTGTGAGTAVADVNIGKKR